MFNIKQTDTQLAAAAAFVAERTAPRPQPVAVDDGLAAYDAEVMERKRAIFESQRAERVARRRVAQQFGSWK